MLKLQYLKSEIRYTPNMILVKLVGSQAISQILLRISEIKRTKMVGVHYLECARQGYRGARPVSVTSSHSSPAKGTYP